MSFICNVCGKEFEDDKKVVVTTEESKEVEICQECNNAQQEQMEKRDFVICKYCGYVVEKKQFKGICGFCNHKDNFENITLTASEEVQLNEEPEKLYAEKLGKEGAEAIANWKNGKESKENEVRLKRDRYIDGMFVLGIILAYFMIDYDINNYLNRKGMFIGLLIPSLLVLGSAPIFRKIDEIFKQKKLPIWLILIMMAIFIDVFVLIIKFL